VRALLILLGLATAAVAAEREPRVSVEVVTPAGTCFVMERVPVTLRVSVDLADFEARSVRLFNRPMDLQMKVRAPWLEAWPGAILLPAASTGAAGEKLSLVLNDDVVALPLAPDRDGIVTLTRTRTFLPERAGVLEIAAPVVTFAYATEFEEDFVRGRRPLDRHDVTVTGKPLRITVKALPEEGRPDGFCGAVGRFTVVAVAAPTAVTVGMGLTLTLRIEGEGNLARFDTPRLPGLTGFHVYGAIDDRAAPVRTIVYSLTSLEGGESGLPAIPFPYFDPTPPGRYRTAETAPIPLEVTGPALPRVPCAVVEVEEDSGGPGLLLVGLAVLVLALGIGFVVLRVLRRDRAAPEPTPAEVFRERMGRPGADVEAALTGYLSTHLGCPPAAVISPDLRKRLVVAGVSEELAGRTAALVTGLVAKRYGGEGSGDERETARRVVRELDSIFAPPSEG